MRRLTRQGPLLVWLTLVWTALWGSFTAANLLGGLLLAGALLLLLPLPEVPALGRVRPVALARLLVAFLGALVTASASVVGLVLRRSSRPRQAVVAVPLVATSDQLLTLLADAVSLTPGTLTLEVDRPRSVLYVHVLDVGSGDDAVEAVRRSISRLERLAILALGTPESRRALDATAARPGQVR